MEKGPRALENLDCETPALVYDERVLAESITTLAHIREKSHCRIVFALKSLAIPWLLRFIGRRLDGFAVSSVFEARLARGILGHGGSVHVTTPGLAFDEIREIVELCDYVSFNSSSQWERFKAIASGRTLCGIRVNPQLSLVQDKRYDPCRKHSKLGAPLDELADAIIRDPKQLDGISGIHFHTNCLSSDFSQLLETTRHLEQHIGDLLHRLEWINLGGGYLFGEGQDLAKFHQVADLLRSKHNLEIFIEPGAAVASKAGYLVSSVLDLFQSDGKRIAILDTTVNHMPEVFEYQFEPDVIGHRDGGRFQYILAGRTCLAGDLFGEYAFDEPLRVGSQVVFANMGAYTLVKAHMFNGVNLPTIYALTESGELVLKQRFTYEDFASRCGADTNVIV
jgi:carboxynorspermidine decarboxylase